MNPIACPHEARVIQSARTGDWDDLTRRHLTECAFCRETLQIAESLGNIAATPGRESPLPDPKRVWLRARIQMTHDERERALRPLAIANLVVKAALAMALACGMVWTWFRIKSLAAGWLPMHLQALHKTSVPEWLVNASQPTILSLAALAMCVAALLFIKLFQPILAED